MFFNKTKFNVTKLSDQVEIKPDVLFSIPLIVMDAISFGEPKLLSATVIKSSGRDIVSLPTVLSVTGGEYNYVISGVILAADWDGVVSISLKVIIDSDYTIVIPLKV
jgi:hypothetical protein